MRLDHAEDGELDRELDRLAAGLKGRYAAGPRFREKVMDSVRAWEAGRLGSAAGAPAAPRSRPAPAWRGLLERLWAPGPRIAFASLLLFALVGTFHHASRKGSSEDAGGDTRIKGQGFRLGFVLKRGGEVGPAVPGAAYRRGDRLQAIYSAPEAGRLILFSLGADGRAACLTCGARDTVLAPGQDRMTAFALELDGSPGQEVLAGFWSGAPRDADSLGRALEDAWRASGSDAGRLRAVLAGRLPAEVALALFPLAKEEAPHGRP